jgi:hypothetical protein
MQNKTKVAQITVSLYILNAIGGRQSDLDDHLRMCDIQDSIKSGYFTNNRPKTDPKCGPQEVPVSAALINLYK